MNRHIVFILILIFNISATYAENNSEYNKIIENLRCLVCQNQSLSESDSNLAKDLRSKVKSMLDSGKSEKEIYKFMSDRYTDYVLYNPPLKKSTFLLWYGPFLILVISIIFLIRFSGKSEKSSFKSKFVNNDNEKLKINSPKKNKKYFYLIAFLFIPVLTLSIYSYSSEYMRYKISYYFESKDPIIDITITIHNDILTNISGNEVLFVYARRSNGMRVPLAIDIFDVTKSKKNYNVRLDNTMSMIKAQTLASADEVIVEARISKYKKAMTMPGDFIGTSGAFKIKSSNYIMLKINSVVKEE
jgi:cytochrome c-type biogenesis protein CcmH